MPIFTVICLGLGALFCFLATKKKGHGPYVDEDIMWAFACFFFFLAGGGNLFMIASVGIKGDNIPWSWFAPVIATLIPAFFCYRRAGGTFLGY